MLEVRGIEKSFPATKALDGVSLRFGKGEVHGLVGENGAGKSTLMKILAGIYLPDAGTILVDDKPRVFRSVSEAGACGIAMIHQELNLVGALSVAENIFLGREPRRPLWSGRLVDRRLMERNAASLLVNVGAGIDPTRLVESLSVAEQQLVEIAKALASNARFLIMDEPTAVLSERETRSLFSLIRRLAANGVAIVYISHLLPEVLAICKRISILRDGRLVETVSPQDVSERKLAELMVGRELTHVFPEKRPAPDAAPALEVQGIAAAPNVLDVSFSVRPGEIIGLAGLVGSGRTEAAEAIIGLRRRVRGTVRVFNTLVDFRSPRDALAARVAYVSEDRKGRGVHLDMNCIENTTLAHLSAYGAVFPSRSRERRAARGWIERLAIRCPDLLAPIRTLSGGNQQKLAVAKWLDGKPSIIILDEPTRGIDLGAKREMYRLIVDLAEAGLACVVISSELPELIGLCHRIVVLRQGRVAGELAGADELTEQRIMYLSAGVDRSPRFPPPTPTPPTSPPPSSNESQQRKSA
ncbi:MAG: sugar ABC transporter ATP-binding protein [Phycisphaerae bacterium]|nr:sugar ABC transporter ATP-binding protein [Phycisphaerae bacterium]